MAISERWPQVTANNYSPHRHGGEELISKMVRFQRSRRLGNHFKMYNYCACNVLFIYLEYLYIEKKKKKKKQQQKNNNHLL